MARYETAELEKLIAAHTKKVKMTGRLSQYYLALALCGEVGELANLLKKDWRGDKNPERRAKKINAEIYDAGNYLFMLASKRGVNVLQGMLRKLLAVERRHAFKNWHAKKKVRRGKRR